MYVPAHACCGYVLGVFDARTGPRDCCRQTFTATYTAFDKQSSAASKVTGVLYKVRAPTGSRLQWHARGVASMSAGGGTQVRTVTVVDDQGVVQTHTAETEDAGRELVATRCADASHFPSLSSVTSSLDSATAVSEGQMREVVGGGACEGDAWTRFLVRVGQVPVVVCWQDGFKQVQVLGEEFYAGEPWPCRGSTLLACAMLRD